MLWTMVVTEMPRYEPYTAIGVKRVPCARCGQKPGHASWNVCADRVGGRTQYRVLCKECDLGMNVLAMQFVFGQDCDEAIGKYRTELGFDPVR